MSIRCGTTISSSIQNATEPKMSAVPAEPNRANASRTRGAPLGQYAGMSGRKMDFERTALADSGRVTVVGQGHGDGRAVGSHQRDVDQYSLEQLADHGRPQAVACFTRGRAETQAFRPDKQEPLVAC